MSRHDRLAQRLRGAGRVAVNNSPVAFKSRRAKTPRSKHDGPTPAKASKTPTKAQAEHDVLVPLTSAFLNTSSKRQLQAKMMDFSTPKTAKKKKPSVASTKKKSENQQTQAEQVIVVADSTRPLSSSTPEHATTVIDGSISLTPFGLERIDTASPIDSVHAAGKEMVILSPTTVVMEEVRSNEQPHSTLSSRKRKIQDTDIQMPVIMSPTKKRKKKLRGLLRELGPGASRFIIGAPNFATPARPKVVEDPAERRYRRESVRKSHRISKANASLSLLDVSILAVAKPKIARSKKACYDCGGAKAWNRWHAMADGSWRCNKCQTTQGASRKSATTRQNTSRLAISLTDDEHVLLIVRRHQGRSYDAIAKELKKWKTGQSVRKYLEKPCSKTRTRALEKLVKQALESNNLPVLAQGQSQQKRHAATRRKPPSRKVTQLVLQAVVADCDPNESDILV